MVLCCATLGELGKAGDPPVCRPEELPAVRERELREACALLGVGALHLLGYRDRELSSAPAEEIRGHLVRLLRATRPTLVLTFDPHGANFHPDHIAISRFTSDAVAAAADPRWYPEAGPAHEVTRLLWAPGRHPWEWTRDEDPGARPGVDFAIDVRPWRERKVAALRAHRTQAHSLHRNFFGQPDADRLLGFEYFRQGWGPALRERPQTDLFA